MTLTTQETLINLQGIFSTLDKAQELSSNDINTTIGSLTALTSLLENDQYNWTDLNQEVAVVALRVLRNSLAMDLMAHSPDMAKIVHIVSDFIGALCKYISSEEGEPILVLLRCSVQVLVNVSGKRTTLPGDDSTLFSEIVFRLLEFKSILLQGDTKLCSYTCLLLSYIWRYAANSTSLVLHDISQLIDTLVSTDDPNVFVFLEVLFSDPEVMSQYFRRLSSEHRTVALDVLDGLVAKQQVLPQDLVLFLAAVFTASFTDVLSLDSGGDPALHSDPLGVVTLLHLLGQFCSNIEPHYPLLVLDNAFLRACIALLSEISTAGKSSPGSVFAVHSKAPTTDTNTLSGHPAFGLKRDIVTCLGNLAHDSSSNQAIIGESGCLELLLECTMLDAKNPFLQQRAIVALRNVCLGHEANSARVRKLKMHGVVDSSGVLADIGVTVSANKDGKLQLRPDS